MAEEELKIVVTIKGKAARVAIQQTDCDPIIFHPVAVNGEEDLRTVLGTVISESLVEARRRWQTNPKYPKADLPAPPPAPAAVATVHRPAAAAPARNNLQTSMF